MSLFLPLGHGETRVKSQHLSLFGDWSTWEDLWGSGRSWACAGTAGGPLGGKEVKPSTGKLL